MLSAFLIKEQDIRIILYLSTKGLATFSFIVILLEIFHYSRSDMSEKLMYKWKNKKIFDDSNLERHIIVLFLRFV